MKKLTSVRVALAASLLVSTIFGAGEQQVKLTPVVPKKKCATCMPADTQSAQADLKYSAAATAQTDAVAKPVVTIVIKPASVTPVETEVPKEHIVTNPLPAYEEVGFFSGIWRKVSREWLCTDRAAREQYIREKEERAVVAKFVKATQEDRLDSLTDQDRVILAQISHPRIAEYMKAERDQVLQADNALYDATDEALAVALKVRATGDVKPAKEAQVTLLAKLSALQKRVIDFGSKLGQTADAGKRLYDLDPATANKARQVELGKQIAEIQKQRNANNSERGVKLESIGEKVKKRLIRAITADAIDAEKLQDQDDALAAKQKALEKELEEVKGKKDKAAFFFNPPQSNKKPKPAAQPVVTPPVIKQPVTIQPVVAQPVTEKPTVSQPAGK